MIGCYSKAWPLLFPQHGPGRKHQRKIELVLWQEEIVDRFPREFLRGLIHADGCRVLNRVNGKDYPRYLFDQVSNDIRRLFCEACDRLGIEYTWSRLKTVSIAPLQKRCIARRVRRSEGLTAGHRTSDPPASLGPLGPTVHLARALQS